MNSLFVNGRFLTRPGSGVDRVAFEMTRAMTALLEEIDGEAAHISLLVPTRLSSSQLQPVDASWSLRFVGHLRGHLWEQLELPRHSQGGWLYNPCNVGPYRVRNQILTIHDAQHILTPGTYSRSFRLWYRFLLPAIGRRANIVTTVSNYSKTQLEYCGILPPGKAHVIYNGCDHIDRIEPDPQCLERYRLEPKGYFLAIGNLSPHKNLGTIAHAANARPPGEPPLVIAGGGNPSVFADAGLNESKSIRILGRVSDQVLKALYQNAIALAFPSITEGFGLPPLEAMRCGCPVVASNGGAIPEVCGNTVLSLDPLDEPGWTDALIQMAQDHNLRNRYRRLGEAHVRHFTWRTAAIELLQLFAVATADQDLSAQLERRYANGPRGSFSD